MSQSNDSGLNLEHLEALARAATPGPWALEDDEPDESTAPRICLGSEIDEYGAPHTGMRIGVEEHHVHPARKPKIGGPQWNALAAKALDNANFIAAANPAAVLELIALARHYRSQADEALEREIARYAADTEKVLEELDDLANQPAPTVPAGDALRQCIKAIQAVRTVTGYSTAERAMMQRAVQAAEVALAHQPAQEQAELHKVILEHCNDLSDCACVLDEDGRFKATAEEIRIAVAELRAATQAAQQEPVAAPQQGDAPDWEGFAMAVLVDARDNLGSDVDGGMIQEAATDCGLLVKVVAHEPCGENCACAEYDTFPQDCYRYSKGALKAIRNEAKRAAQLDGGQEGSD
jgi:hypothetical protein